MADKTPSPSIKKAKSLAGFIQSSLDKIYTTTHFNSPTNVKDLEALKAKINQSIRSITDNNLNNIGEPNISRLYSRLLSVQNDKTIVNDIDSIFSDEALMGTMATAYLDNKWILDLDAEIETVIKYMPKLQEALDTRKENVLSSDHFSKDFVNIVNLTDISDDKYNANIKDMKDRYELAALFDSVYDNASKYGEEFLYIIPYDKALDRLINPSNSNLINSKMNMESGMIISENGNMRMDDIHDFVSDEQSLTNAEQYNLEIELNMSNMVLDVVKDAKMMRNKIDSIIESSLTNDFRQAVNEEQINRDSRKEVIVDNGHSSIKVRKLDKTIDDKLSFNGFSDDSGADGLITLGKANSTNKIQHINGAVIRTLNHSQVIPIYIDDFCLGYYYFEFADGNMYQAMQTHSNSPMNTNAMKIMQQETMEASKQDSALAYISAQLSKFIDSKFINANQDYKKEIYMILKHNDLTNKPNNRIRVTFIPPEDMVHVYFKLDKKTHHGISDLDKAILPGKLFVSLYMTNLIAQMTRGQDRRVYYIKQNVETNISKTMLNTIEQIKKNNFGIRQIESINNVLNIIGRFNDFVIPMSSSGDAPIQFEVMPGQQIDTKSDLMDMLEEMAINSTDVPIEVIQARRSMDYALQYSMSNSKFLRKIYYRQGQYQKFLSKICTKIYNYEFNKNEQLDVILPPPMFLNVSNTNQMITNTNEMIQSIIDMEYPNESDQLKLNTFSRNLKRYYLGTYINIEMIDEIKKKSEMEAAINKTSEDAE